MSTLHSLPAPIPLAPSLAHRLADGLALAFATVARGWRRRAQQRLLRRRASAQQALIDSLDARTLRDLGLGDWAAARPEAQHVGWREIDAFRF